jgi:hypothetical protein
MKKKKHTLCTRLKQKKNLKSYSQKSRTFKKEKNYLTENKIKNQYSLKKHVTVHIYDIRNAWKNSKQRSLLAIFVRLS